LEALEEDRGSKTDPAYKNIGFDGKGGLTRKLEFLSETNVLRLDI
jgi:hypothetical protein